MVKSHFIDLDTLIKIDNKAWIVDKTNPNIPIMKISKSDFNLLKSGIWRNQGNKIDFNGEIFWLPTDMVNKLKVKSKISNINISNLAISLQEFLNKELVDEMDFEINKDLINILSGIGDDIYIICSKQTRRVYDESIQRLKEKLLENGINIKYFYYISETFYNQKSDDIIFKKNRLLIQHLIGYKTNFDKFIDEEIDRYGVIEYYDNQPDTNLMTGNINNFLNLFFHKTDSGLRSVIKEDILEYEPRLVVNYITDNKMNPIITKAVNLKISNVIKTFGSFNQINGI